MYWIMKRAKKKTIDSRRRSSQGVLGLQDLLLGMVLPSGTLSSSRTKRI
jgi:hypothetical protein